MRARASSAWKAPCWARGLCGSNKTRYSGPAPHTLEGALLGQRPALRCAAAAPFMTGPRIQAGRTISRLRTSGPWVPPCNTLTSQALRPPPCIPQDQPPVMPAPSPPTPQTRSSPVPSPPSGRSRARPCRQGACNGAVGRDQDDPVRSQSLDPRPEKEGREGGGGDSEAVTASYARQRENPSRCSSRTPLTPPLLPPTTHCPARPPRPLSPHAYQQQIRGRHHLVVEVNLGVAIPPAPPSLCTLPPLPSAPASPHACIPVAD